MPEDPIRLLCLPVPPHLAYEARWQDSNLQKHSLCKLVEVSPDCASIHRSPQKRAHRGNSARSTLPLYPLSYTLQRGRAARLELATSRLTVEVTPDCASMYILLFGISANTAQREDRRKLSGVEPEPRRASTMRSTPRLRLCACIAQPNHLKGRSPEEMPPRAQGHAEPLIGVEPTKYPPAAPPGDYASYV